MAQKFTEEELEWITHNYWLAKSRKDFTDKYNAHWDEKRSPSSFVGVISKYGLAVGKEYVPVDERGYRVLSKAEKQMRDCVYCMYACNKAGKTARVITNCYCTKERCVC